MYSRFDMAAWIVDNATCNRPNVATVDINGLASPLACCGAHPDLFGQCVLPNVTSGSGGGGGSSEESSRATDGDSGLQQHGCCGACAAGFCEPGEPPNGDCPPGVPPTPVDGPPWWLPPINNCDYDMAGDMLTFLLGGKPLKPRKSAVASNLLAFDQGHYISTNASFAAMDATGFVYAPAACRDAAASAACRVHVHYHPCGCLPTQSTITNGTAVVPGAFL